MGLFHRHSGSPRSVSAVILPRRFRCGGRLVFSLPARYIPRYAGRHTTIFDAERSCLRLIIMQVPFARRLRAISAIELQVAFRKLIPVQIVPAVTYGFLRRSAMLTAVWEHPGAAKQKTVLRLIQRGKTACIFWFSFVLPLDMPEIEAIFASMDMEPAG